MPHLATAILRIANGETKSTSLGDYFGANPAKVALDNAAGITIQGPSALTAACTVQVAQVSPAADADFAALAYDGSDVTVAAAKNTIIPLPAARDLRIVSAGAEAADRDFYVTIQEDLFG